MLWNNNSTSGANSYIRDNNQNNSTIPTAKKFNLNNLIHNRLLEQMKRTNSTLGTGQTYLKSTAIKPAKIASKDSSALMMFDTSKNINDQLKPFHKKTNSQLVNTCQRSGINSKSTSSKKKITSSSIYQRPH